MENKKRKMQDEQTNEELAKLSEQIKESSNRPEDVYLNPSESDSNEESSLEDEEEEVSEIVKDFQHKMYNDIQKLNKLLQNLKLENERISKRNHYLQLSHNNERIDKFEAWKKIKLQLEVLKKKNKLIQKQRYLLAIHIALDVVYVSIILQYMGWLPYIMYLLEKGSFVLYHKFTS